MQLHFQICAIIVMPFWQLCISKFGKKSTFATGMMVGSVLCIINIHFSRKSLLLHCRNKIWIQEFISVAL